MRQSTQKTAITESLSFLILHLSQLYCHHSRAPQTTTLAQQLSHADREVQILDIMMTTLSNNYKKNFLIVLNTHCNFVYAYMHSMPKTTKYNV